MPGDAELAPFRLNFSMRDLWHFTLWAAAATGALMLVVYAGSTETGRNRMLLAFSQFQRTTQPSRVAEPRPFDAKEGQKLAEAVRLLTADRNRLLARLTTLEHNVDDITGSLARVEKETQATQAALAARVAKTEQAARAAQAAQAEQAAKAERAARAAKADQAARAAQAAKAEQAARAAHAEQTARAAQAERAARAAQAEQTARAAQAEQAAQRVRQPGRIANPADDVTSSINPRSGVTIPRQAPAAPPASAAPQVERSQSSAAARTHFGLDLGGASSIGALRRLWATARQRHPAQTARLHPIVQPHRHTFFGGIEWRLVAGPIASATTAAALCAAVAATGDGCRVAVFQGERLADR